MISLKQKIKNKINRIVYECTNQAIKQTINENYPELLSSISSLHIDLKGERDLLLKIRNSKEFDKAFDLKNPLVSVRISTYNRSKTLIEKTIPSILNQSYKNIEIIIVGDHCTDDTEKRIRSLGKNNIHFYNMTYRGQYPQNKYHKWLVAGTPAANEALQRARGKWIAPFDDDDEMSPTHIEDLLMKAQKDKLEFVYGKAESIDINSNIKKIVGAFPPSYGHISFNSSIFHSGLKFFEYYPYSWTINEPGDWNVIKRMMLCGVTMGFIDKVVTKINFVHPKYKTGYNPEL